MTEKLQSILQAEGLSGLLGKFNEQGVTDSILCDLNDSDLKELGVDKLGERKRLLAAFGKSGGGGAVAVSVVEESAPQGGSSGAPSKTAATPEEATKDSPWVNTLGMPFVPIPRFETRFCVWPVRVQDYEAYCMASGAKFPEIPFPQESDHPIVGVSWNDAIEFCVWLTGKERAEGKIDDKIVYRLPTDLEWSAAVGLPHEPEATPAQRHLKAPGYPWGLRWPPPQNAGNYERRRKDELRLARRADFQEEGANAEELQNWHNLIRDLRLAAARWASEWNPVDSYEFTSPVNAFVADQSGIHDLGGNVWEWVMDSINYKGATHPIARGGSFAMCPEGGLSDGRRIICGAGTRYTDEQYLTVESQKVYSSSYRHISTGSQPGLILSVEHNPVAPSEWNNIPCGGFRVVVSTC
jgi:formylglycine-generating enzyme required for sulfatase activity